MISVLNKYFTYITYLTGVRRLHHRHRIPIYDRNTPEHNTACHLLVDLAKNNNMHLDMLTFNYLTIFERNNIYLNEIINNVAKNGAFTWSSVEFRTKYVSFAVSRCCFDLVIGNAMCDAVWEKPAPNVRRCPLKDLNGIGLK